MSKTIIQSMKLVSVCQLIPRKSTSNKLRKIITTSNFHLKANLIMFYFNPKIFFCNRERKNERVTKTF